MRAKNRSRVLALLVLALGTATLAGCIPTTAPTSLTITTTPGLYPGFDNSVSDYVVRCDGSPVSVQVEAPADTEVSVAGQAAATGSFTSTVPLTTDEAFTIAVQQGTGTVEHSVRCLPSDFPAWTASRSGSTRAPFYLTTPIDASTVWYPVILDGNGVPVWWGSRLPAIFTTLLPDGNVASVTSSGLVEETLAGAPVRAVATVGGDTDQHDVALLQNGHVVLAADIPRAHVDLSALGGPNDTSIVDQVIQEIDPADGHVVWSWDVADHISVDEMDPQWYGQYINGATAPYDVFHWNSIEITPTGYLLSFRHLDAVYAIDGTTGDIQWKLGGSSTPQSLTVRNDPVFDGGSHLGGQHDARVLTDGSVTLYDDGTNLGRSPRAVRYAIDTTAHTATMVESMKDRSVTSTFCCGDARRLGPYDWVMGWGGDSNGTASENVIGLEGFSLHFSGVVMYRMVPLTSGEVTITALRSAMDARAASLGTEAAVPAPGPGSFPFPP